MYRIQQSFTANTPFYNGTIVRVHTVWAAGVAPTRPNAAVALTTQNKQLIRTVRHPRSQLDTHKKARAPAIATTTGMSRPLAAAAFSVCSGRPELVALAAEPRLEEGVSTAPLEMGVSPSGIDMAPVES